MPRTIRTVAMQRTLNRVLSACTMSPMLREAITETIEALRENNLQLAYQLTASKSYIVSVINPKNKIDAFQEDSIKNQKVLRGRSVYSVLDHIHHNIAFKIDAIPSGSSIVTARGTRTMKNTVKVFSRTVIGNHPIIKRIRKEQKRIEITASNLRRLYP